MRVPNRTKLLILQHPQEARNPLTTARLLSASLNHCVHRVGLSWPSLRKAWGEETAGPEWVVLYLGSLGERKKRDLNRAIEFIERNGKPSDPSFAPKGIVLLDGTWKQAKTLWWRNPWLLRLRRAILNPDQPSVYGTVRRQPRAECLSSIEAAAHCLEALGENSTVIEPLYRLRDLALAAALTSSNYSVSEERITRSTSARTAGIASSSGPEILIPAE